MGTAEGFPVRELESLVAEHDPVPVSTPRQILTTSFVTMSFFDNSKVSSPGSMPSKDEIIKTLQSEIAQQTLSQLIEVSHSIHSISTSMELRLSYRNRACTAAATRSASLLPAQHYRVAKLNVCRTAPRNTYTCLMSPARLGIRA